MIFLVIFMLKIWISMGGRIWDHSLGGGSEFGTIPLGRYQYFDARYGYFGARCQISVSKSMGFVSNTVIKKRANITD